MLLILLAERLTVESPLPLKKKRVKKISFLIEEPLYLAAKRSLPNTIKPRETNVVKAALWCMAHLGQEQVKKLLETELKDKD